MRAHSENFLPDLCNVQSVLALVLVGELLALALTIADLGLAMFDWLQFGMTSIAVQWVILSSAGCICPMRPWFDRFGGFVAGAVSYIVVLCITLLVTVAGSWVRHLSLTFDWYQITGNLIIASILAGIFLRYFYIQQQLRSQQQAELMARVQALQSRIRPHFLFNSMNSIASLIDIDPEQAEKMVVDLSQLFRASLKEPGFVSIRSEIELCKQFVSIEQVRLGSRMTVEWQLDERALDAQIPSLLLQPIIENAIYHGIQPLPEGGQVDINVKLEEDGNVHIRVINPYAAGKPSDGANNSMSVVKGNGMALENIQNRLVVFYGKKASINIDRADGVYRVDISLPAQAINKHGK